MVLRALFLDFNSYFASVEQQEQPQLREKPVAVVPTMAETTCCIASSYEARQFGVKTGTRVAEARRLCPQLQFVEARPDIYTQYHYRLLDVIETCIPIKEVKSVDEVLCDLRGSQCSRENSTALAMKIKATIAAEVGPYLRCSIGIAPNMFLAKTATEMQKPDGLVVIDQENLPGCLFGLEIRDIYGVGPRMEKRLWNHGIVSVEQLWNASRAKLRNVWGGVCGERMYDELRGIEPVRPPHARASISHSHVLPPDLRHAAGAHAVLSRLLQKAAIRLRRMKYSAGGLEVCIKDCEDGYWWDKAIFKHTSDTLVFTEKMNLIWQDRPLHKSAPLKVSVVLFGLRPSNECNLSLFETHRELDETVDYLNERYGRMKVYLGGAHQVRSTSAQPIAFNFVPEIVEVPTKQSRAQKKLQPE